MKADRDATLTRRECSQNAHQKPLARRIAELSGALLLLSLAAPPLHAVERSQAKAELVWSEQPAPAAKRNRQTSFDETNYRPAASVNLIPPPAETYWPGAEAARYASSEQLLRQDSWEWLSANRTRVNGRFEWIERDGAISYASVCQNYRKGSIIYRDCRKGAKQAFARMCSSYKPACHAANNFMP